MGKIKEVKIVTSLEPYEITIPCASCRREMEVGKLYYDPASAEVLCEICRCVYATVGQQQIEMEDK